MHENVYNIDFNRKSRAYSSLLSGSLQNLGFSLFSKLERFLQGLLAFLRIVKMKLLAMQLIRRMIPTHVPASYFFTFPGTVERFTDAIVTRGVIPQRRFTKGRSFWRREIDLRLPIIRLGCPQRLIGTSIHAVTKEFGDNLCIAIQPD